MKTDFLFAVFPYLAAGLLAAGIVVRYLLLRKQDEIVSAEISQARAVFASGRLWQASFLLLFVGHVIALALPRAILLWNGNGLRLYLLEGIALAIGAAALGGWLVLMRQNLKRHNGSVLAEVSDTVLLALLFVGIFSGLLAAVLYRWGSSWGAMTLTPYFISLLRGRPAAGLVVQMPFLVRLHVFSLFAAVAIVPVTRLGTAIVGALQGMVTWVSGPLSTTARAIEAWLRKHNPAPWFWPEED